MSWHQLSTLGVTVRPLSNLRPEHGNRRALFSATLGSTMTLLAAELRNLDADRIVLELDLRERDIRADGLPRADARCSSATVVLSFESKYGPLRYATCEFTDWTDNLRAIALAMEALRAVDRYGVSKRGEQYVGWRALPVSTDPADTLTEAQALDLLWAYAAPDAEDLASALRMALFSTHPDRGGDADEFRRVMRAKELLGL